MFVRTSLAALIAALHCFPSTAEEALGDPLRDEALVVVAEQVRPSKNAILDRVGWAFDWADIDGGGIGESDIRAESRTAAASARADLMREFFEADINADNVVTFDELHLTRRIAQSKNPDGGRDRKFPGEDNVARRIEQILLRGGLRSRKPSLFKERSYHGCSLRPTGFSDETRSMTLEQAIELVSYEIPSDGTSIRTPERYPFAQFDRDEDGTVTRDEVVPAIANVFDEFDLDDDQRLSHQERRALKDAAKEARTRIDDRFRATRGQRLLSAVVRACNWPQATPEATIFLFESNHPRASATVKAGNADQFKLFDLHIEPGEEPLYLLVGSSKPTIHRVSGAVERIEQIIGLADSVVFTGIDPSKVSRTGGATCSNESFETLARGSSNNELIPRLFGREIDGSVRVPYPARISLPSGKNEIDVPLDGKVEIDVTGEAGPVWKDYLRFNPAGLIEIDPDDIVPRDGFTRLDSLPNLGGLAQLIEEGTLTLLSEDQPLVEYEGRAGIAGARGGISMTPDGIVFYTPDFDGVVRGKPLHRFRVNGAMTFPEGLGGAMGAIFVVPKGIPAPKGDPRRNEVIIE